MGNPCEWPPAEKRTTVLCGLGLKEDMGVEATLKCLSVMSSNRLKFVQLALLALGVTSDQFEADGTYGPKTEAAVRALFDD